MNDKSKAVPSLSRYSSPEFGLASYKQGLAEGYAILETWIKERIEYAVSDEQLADQLRVKFDMASTANTPTTEGK